MEEKAVLCPLCKKEMTFFNENEITIQQEDMEKPLLLIDVPAYQCHDCEKVYVSEKIGGSIEEFIKENSTT